MEDTESIINNKMIEIEKIIEDALKEFKLRTNRIKIRNLSKKSKIKMLLQHYFNELHLFCRLLNLGLTKKRSLTLSKKIANALKAIIY